MNLLYSFFILLITSNLFPNFFLHFRVYHSSINDYVLWPIMFLMGIGKDPCLKFLSEIMSRC